MSFSDIDIDRQEAGLPSTWEREMIRLTIKVDTSPIYRVFGQIDLLNMRAGFGCRSFTHTLCPAPIYSQVTT